MLEVQVKLFCRSHGLSWNPGELKLDVLECGAKLSFEFVGFDATCLPLPLVWEEGLVLAA